MVSNLWFWGGWWWLAPSSTVTMMPLQWINEFMILGWWSLWPRSWRQALTTAYKAMPARSHRRSWCDNAIVYVQQISRWHIVCCKLLQVRSGFRHAKRLLSSESPHWRTTTWTVAKWILKAWRKKNNTNTEWPNEQFCSCPTLKTQSEFNPRISAAQHILSSFLSVWNQLLCHLQELSMLNAVIKRPSHPPSTPKFYLIIYLWLDSLVRTATAVLVSIAIRLYKRTVHVKLKHLVAPWLCLQNPGKPSPANRVCPSASQCLTSTALSWKIVKLFAVFISFQRILKQDLSFSKQGVCSKFLRQLQLSL